MTRTTDICTSEFAKLGGNQCPKCGSYRTHSHTIKISRTHDYCSQHSECFQCPAKWDAVYCLAHVTLEGAM